MLKNIWTYVAGLFVALLGAFLYEKKQANDANSKLSTANTDKQDAVLAQQQVDNQSKIDDVIKQGEIKKQENKSLEDIAKDLEIKK